MLEQFYKDKYIRKRIVKFLGGTSLEEATAIYITAEDESSTVLYTPKPVDRLWSYLDKGLDVGRSLWDRSGLIAHLDIDYVNFMYPGEPHVKPSRTFDIQYPVRKAAQEILLEYGITPLHLLSGRGHHFIWKIAQHSHAFNCLINLAYVPETLQAKYQRSHPPTGESVDLAFGAAFSGLGLVMEFLSHQILEKVADSCPIPVELTAVEVNEGQQGREVVAIDISEYGDPLHLRSIRMPFSAYLKPQQQRSILGEHVVESVPQLFLIPLFEMDEKQGLLVMRDMGQVAELARHAPTDIPDESDSMVKLVKNYSNSRLEQFHDFFYSDKHDPPDKWHETYDRTPFSTLPPCARRVLQYPNDLLLKPDRLQHVTRVLLSYGWHPRHIAGLIRSKYERDFGWGNMWYQYDASSRADFYTRIFSGLIMTGMDTLHDFNCPSVLEQGYCMEHECQSELEPLKQSLLERRRYE